MVLVPTPTLTAELASDLINERIGIYRRRCQGWTSIATAVNRDPLCLVKAAIHRTLLLHPDAPLSQPESRTDRLQRRSSRTLWCRCTLWGLRLLPLGRTLGGRSRQPGAPSVAEVMSSVQSNGGYIAVQLERASWFKPTG